MPHSLPFSRRTYFRAAALRAGLDPLIDELDAIPVERRRSPMPASLRERGWPAVERARRTLGLAPLPDSVEREMPGELATEIVAILHRLTSLKPPAGKATPGARKKSYPRRSRRV